MLLTTTFGFTRGSTLIFAYNSSLNSNPLSALGFPSYLQSNGFNGVPAMFIGGGYYSAGYTTAGGDPYGNYDQGQDTGQLSAMLNKIHGSHELKFGLEGRIHQQNYIQTNAPVGIFNFDNRGTQNCPQDPNYPQCGGGDGLASFLTGQTQSGYYEIQFRPASENYQYATFFQDNWKATHKLTLNLGLRYEVSLPRTERHNRMNWFDPNVVSPLIVPGMGTLYGGERFDNSSIRTNWVPDWKDVSPRFGFAYQFAPNTVLRGGYGIYYAQNRSAANGLLSYGSEGFNQYTGMITTYQNDGATPYLHLSNPYPNGLIQPSGSSLGLMTDVGYGAVGPLRTSTEGRTPYEQSWTFGIERQLPFGVVLDAEYLGKKGTHLYFSGSNSLDVLGPQIESYTPAQVDSQLQPYVQNPFAAVNGGPISDPNSVLSSPTIQQFMLDVPYPQFPGGVTTDVRPIANSTYHALQLSVQKQFSHGLQFIANYTWSKSIDDSSIYDDNLTWLGSFTSLQDPNKPWLERSLSTFDVPSMLKFSYTYELPIGRGKALLGNMPRAVDMIFGGWKTNGIWQISSGRPLSFSLINGGVPLPTYSFQRPNVVGKPRRNYGGDWVDNFFANPGVFQAPDEYALGNEPRATGAIRTPLSFTSDLSLTKEFLLSKVHEGVHMELRLEAANAFNHPVFGTPDSAVGDPSFGTISYLAVGPRQGQLALKVTF
ncbi:MAG: TonB-dependent receptor [Terriglobales bacterium]